MKKEETINYPDGNKYVGEVSDGVPNGRGTLTGPGGDEYVGEFRNAKFSGQGTFNHSNGTQYSGEWADNQPNGHGTMTYEKSSGFSEYTGEFKDGKRRGQGTMLFSDGSKYIGKWENGEQHGQGEETLIDGSTYVGEWVHNTKSDRGTLTQPDGHIYEGQWIGDKKIGHGSMSYPNGEKYVGEWMDDVRHGQGTYTYIDGSTYEGAFKYGEPTDENDIRNFLPKGSLYFGVLEKITTIIPEGRQLIIGDPSYGVDDSEVDDCEDPNRLRQLPHEKLFTRISLPTSTESIGVFEVLSGEASDEVYGYYLEFIEPDPNGQGYSEEHIAELPVDSANLMVCDETSSRYVLLEESWTFHHKPLGASFGSSPGAPRATFLDDGNVRGILIDLGADGWYDIYAVYEGDHNQDSVIGILVITRPINDYDP